MYYEIPVKHVGCGLHFSVYSWNEEWEQREHLFCPECGGSEGMLVWKPVKREGQIFNVVPGEAQTVARLGT